MKTDGKMSYRDFIFPNNPEIIRITHSRKISKLSIANGFDYVEDFGGGYRIISGEGEFFGENAQNDFDSLKAVFEKGGGGMLYLPSQKPVYAVFESLELIGEDIDGVFKYKFRFAESFGKTAEHKEKFYYSDGESCLWDYSYQNNISIEKLLQLNPNVMRPDKAIPYGKRVFLC